MKRFSAIIVLAVVSWTIPAGAEEPAEMFVEALRENGYYDVALDYLKGLESNGLATPEFQKVLPFERAETLIKSTSQLRNIEAWETRLNEAEQLLKQFASSADTGEAVSKAERYRGNLLYKRARIYSYRSESDRMTAAEKEELLNQSRGFLEQSLAAYGKARAALRELQENYPNDPEAKPGQMGSKEYLKKIQATYTQIRVRLPMVSEQLADTYPPNNPKRDQLLKDASEEYIKLWDAYSRYPAGLDSGLFAARCMSKLGQPNDALTQLQEIFALGDNSAFRVLKRNALVLASECWDKVDPFPADEVIKRCLPEIETLTRQELREPDWLTIQLTLARAYRSKAEEIGATDQPGAAGQAKNLNREAAKLAKSVSRVPGELQEVAKQLLAEWNIKFTVADAEEAPPATFDDAKQKSQDLVTEVESVVNEVNQLKREIATPSNDAIQLKIELEDATERLNLQTEAALQMFDLTLSLVESETLREDINKIRYFQSFCYFANGQYFESALVGEWLLDRYPKVNWTRQSTALIVKSYVALYQDADQDNRTFERDRLVKTCDRVIDEYPGSSEAGVAAGTMTEISINEKDSAAAEKYFVSIPADSFSRTPLAIRLGTRLWYDRKTKDDPNFAATVAKSKKYLKEGLDGLDIQQLDFRAGLASILLVEAHLLMGETDLAVKRLESDKIAPLDLVKQKHPAIMDSKNGELFVRETYRVAVKTYLAAMKTATDQEKWITKSRGVISAMQEQMRENNDPAARQRLTAIYRLIASELKVQFESLQSATEKSKFANNLGLFLESIEKESKDARTVLWAGSTLLDVANSLVEQGEKETAAPLFKQAVSALSKAESLGFAGESKADALKIELMRQRGLAHRGSGNFDAAMKQFVEILQQKSSSLDVQINSAETLQMWGKSTKRSKLFAEAMMGREKVKSQKSNRETNLIWGWRKLVSATQDNEKFESTFYMALYNLIEARLEYGLIEKSEKAITSALKELENAKRRNAELGGPPWKSKFVTLESRIRQHVKE